jgi:hypothetical protein
MGWQDQLADQIREARADPNTLALGNWPEQWTTHAVWTSRAVAVELTRCIAWTNATELAGAASEMLMLINVDFDEAGGLLTFGARINLGWNHVPTLAEVTTVADPCSIDRWELKFVHSRDAHGQLRHPTFDFAAVKESWRDLPPLA